MRFIKFSVLVRKRLHLLARVHLAFVPDLTRNLARLAAIVYDWRELHWCYWKDIDTLSNKEAADGVATVRCSGALFNIASDQQSRKKLGAFHIAL